MIIVASWSGWHWWDGSHRTLPNPWKQNYSSLHKFQQDLDQLLKKRKGVFSICMQSPHLPSCAASRGSICKHFSTFIAMLLPVQSFTEIHSDFPFLQGCLLIFFQLSWPSGNWNRRAQTPCQRFCFTVLWCSLWLSDEYQFNYTWEPWLSFLLLSQKCGNEFQLLLKNCYSATIKYRICTVHGLFYSPSKLNSIKLHVSSTVRDIKLLQSHVGCGNALNQEIVNTSTPCPKVPFAEAPFKLVWKAAGVINTSLYSGHLLWNGTKGAPWFCCFKARQQCLWAEVDKWVRTLWNSCCGMGEDPSCGQILFEFCLSVEILQTTYASEISWCISRDFSKVSSPNIGRKFELVLG